MDRPTWLQIDLSRLEANLACWRRALEESSRSAQTSTQICAVVKASAYGLGTRQITQRLCNCGVDMLAVFNEEQAEELCEIGIDVPVLLFIPATAVSVSDRTRQAAHSGRLHLSIHDPNEVGVTREIARRLGCRLPIHLYVDTGMSRGGLGTDQIGPLLRQLLELPSVRLAGVYTHFATADADEGFVAEQVRRLDAALNEHRPHLPKDLLVHVASTYSACRHQQYHRDMVRLGLGLYGYGPLMLPDDQVIAELRGLQPVVRWSARLVHVRQFPKNATVGYGRTHRLKRDSTLGLLPVGYGDGYPFALSNHSVVQMGNAGEQRATVPILGQVNMDQIVVDLTDVPHARSGDPVDLISDDPASPCSLENLAKLADTNCYEMLCRLAPHLPREYVE